MLLTGMAPYNNGVLDNNVPMNDPNDSVANVFQQEGYYTGYIGKWHLQMPSSNPLEPFGFSQLDPIGGLVTGSGIRLDIHKSLGEQ